MLALIGRKVGAPWTSAALEKGMEAYPGQPTVRDLDEIYAYRDITKATRFVAVTGSGERAYLAAGLLNAAFRHLGWTRRVLPVPMGNRKMFRKIADAVKLLSVFVDERNYEGLHEIARLDESSHSPVLAADGLLPEVDGWSAFNGLGPATVAAIEAVMKERGGDGSLRGRTVMLAGCGALTRMLAIPLKAQGASLIWASRNRAAVQTMSQTFGGRQVLWEAVYATSHDVLVIGKDGEDDPLGDSDELPFHPGYLKPGMTIVDLTAGLRPSKFLREAEIRACGIVTPQRLLIEQVREHVRKLGGEVPAGVLAEKLAGWGVEP
jgi:3-dehydroquinate dehydratase/shikimate dehydrogenase